MTEDPLLSSLKRLVGDAAVYLAGTAAVGAAGILLVPLYTHHLSPAGFGTYALIEAIIQLAVILVTLGVNVSYLRWFAELDAERRRHLYGATMLLVTAVAMIVGSCLALLTLAGIGNRVTGVEPHGYLWTIAPLVVSGAVSNIVLTELRCQRRAVVFSLASLIRLVGTVGASLYTVSVAPGGVSGILYGRLIGDALGVLLLLGVSRRSLAVPGEWPELKAMVRYGLPVMASALVISLLGVTGRYFLSWFGTLTDVGLFSAASKLAGIVNLLLVQPFGIAWGGLMFQIAHEPHSKRVYAIIWSGTWILGWGIVGAIGLIAPELFAVFTAPAYHGAQSVFPWLLASQLMILMQYPAAIGIYLEKRTPLLSFFYVGGLAINIGLGIPLVIWSGSVGAAAAWCGANFLITVTTWMANQRLYPLQWSPVRFVLVGAIGAGLLWVGVSFGATPWGADVALRIAAGLGACLAAGALLARDFRSLHPAPPADAVTPAA